MRRLAALLFAVALPAYATPIELNIKFRVDRILLSFFEQTETAGPNPFSIGDGFSARLTVDDSILATDGRHAGKVTNFYSQIGLSVWDQNRPYSWSFPGSGSDFAGMVGPCTLSDTIVGCRIPDLLLFDVLDHQVVGLFGGVYGASDFPWIDFIGDQFVSVPHYYYGGGGLRRGEDLAVQGAIRVPEPGTLALALLALGWMGSRMKKESWIGEKS